MGTTSATRRQSHVSRGIQPWGQRQLLTLFRNLGGEPARGAILAAAALLAAAGCILPHADAQLIAAVLFVAAAATALVAFVTFDAPSTLSSPDSVPRPVAQRARPLPRTLQELIQANEGANACDLAQWHRLTHRMSHELRTPLNAVLGFSEVMASEVFGPLGSPQYLDYAKSINASGRILLKSAEDALAITSLLTGLNARSRNPVASVRNAVIDMAAFHAAGLDHKPSLLIPASLDLDCEIVGEAQTLRQILINLAAEALDHASHETNAAFACTCAGDEVCLSISLEGPQAAAAGHDNSFSLLLARTLVQLSQARMIEETTATRWCATVIFQRAQQRDFFALEAA